jgi:transcription elongation factor GreA-like protein
MEGTPASIEPGCWVRHPSCSAWGVGQVQSVVGDRVTVNFEHAGKILINAAVVALEVLDGPPLFQWA